MTTHRHDEAITFVSWNQTDDGRGGPLHIRRPRSQKGVAYCGELVIQTRRLPLVRDFTIEHPDEIPLEIRIERDFARLCSKCARAFFNEVGADYGAGVLISVPIAWQAIYARTGRSSVQISVARKDVERLEREAEDEARDAIDAEAAEHAEDDSLERSAGRE